MSNIRRCVMGLAFLATLAALPVLSGCSEPEPPPVEVENIDFQEAEKEATKEYGGGM